MKLSPQLQSQLRKSFDEDYQKNVEALVADVRTVVYSPASRPTTAAPTGKVIIEVADVFKEHKMHKKGQTVQALRGVNLQVRAGEIVACIGPSGSGKSTLMNLIGGLDKPTKGNVTVNGVVLNSMKDHELSTYRNQTIGFVFQFFYLQPYLTVLQNVEIPLIFRGEDKEKRHEAAQKAIEAVGLQERASHLPHQLSGGQMQRVAIARALVNQPQIVLADEPTGNLDKTTGAEIIELLEKINREHGTTIVLVTHDPIVASHAHRVVTVSDGLITQNI